LEEYEYNIIYKPGIQNTNADALSRINITKTAQENEPINEYQIYTEEKARLLISNKDVLEVMGNLFEALAEYAIGHCVSQDFKMIKNIFLEFRRKFGKVEQLKNQNKQLTEIASVRSEGR